MKREPKCVVADVCFEVKLRVWTLDDVAAIAAPAPVIATVPAAKDATMRCLVVGIVTAPIRDVSGAGFRVRRRMAISL
jgi:hypothetical protein